MKKELPLVSILMAVYKPDIVWFREQLESLNKQTYKNIELIIWDDCPEFPCDEETIKACIIDFKYTLYRGEKNVGSNGAFEELTKLGNGKYFSYCDQDDIWLPNKIEKMVTILEQTDSPLVCSDVYIIDKTGKKTANSIKDVHKRHSFYEGKDVARRLIFSNFVMGCASLVGADIAKQCLPFCKIMIYDQWYGIFAALHGNVEILREPLVAYRKHDNNQTGILVGIDTKKDYYNLRLVEHLERMEELSIRLKDEKELILFFEQYLAWIKAKVDYFTKPNFADLKTMFTYREFGLHQVIFDIALHFMPEFVFKWIVRLFQKGKL